MPFGHDVNEILGRLDAAFAGFRVNILDNSYVFPAAARLSLYRSGADWALVFEEFGYAMNAPERGGGFGTTLQATGPGVQRKGRLDFRSEARWRQYLEVHKDTEASYVYPTGRVGWALSDAALDAALEAPEPLCERFVHTVAAGSGCLLRGERIAHPDPQACAAAGVVPAGPGLAAWELARVLAHARRAAVLATEAELRACLAPAMRLFLQLDAWRHPRVHEDELPSGLEGFRQMAEALAAGDPSLYRAPEPPNTHWLNWPESGLL